MSSTLTHSPRANTSDDFSDMRPSPPPSLSTRTRSPQGPSPRAIPDQNSTEKTVEGQSASHNNNTSTQPTATPTDARGPQQASSSSVAAKQLFASTSPTPKTDTSCEAADPLVENNDVTPSTSPAKTSVSPDSATRRSPVLTSPRTSAAGVSRPEMNGPSSGRGLVPLLQPTPPSPLSSSHSASRRVSQRPPLNASASASASASGSATEESASVLGSRRLIVRQLSGTVVAASVDNHHGALPEITKSASSPTAASASAATAAAAASSPTTTTGTTTTLTVTVATTGPTPPMLGPRRTSLGASFASSSASSATSSARPSFRRNVLTLQRYASGNNISDALGTSVASSISTTLTSLSPSLHPIVDANGAPVSGRSASYYPRSASDAGSCVALSGEGSLLNRQASGGSSSGPHRTFRRTTTPRSNVPAAGSDGNNGGCSRGGASGTTTALTNNNSNATTAVRNNTASNPEMHSFLRHQYMLLQQDATGLLENTAASAKRTSTQQRAGDGTAVTDRSPAGKRAATATAAAADADAPFVHVLRSECPRHSKAARAALEKKLEEDRLLNLQRQHHYEKIIINGGHEQVDPSLKKSTSLASALSRQQKKRQTLQRGQETGGTLTRSSSSLYNSMVITSTQNSGKDSDDENDGDIPALAATTGGIDARYGRDDDSPVVYGSMYGHGLNGSDDDDDNEFASNDGAALDADEKRKREAARVDAWQRSSAASMYGHGGSGSGRGTNYHQTNNTRPRSASAVPPPRPSSAAAGAVVSSSAAASPAPRQRRFSLDTMSLAAPQKSGASGLARAQSVGGDVGAVRKVTEFTVPLGKDSSSSSDEEEGGERTAPSASSSNQPGAQGPQLYGPPSVCSAPTRASRNNNNNSVREGGEMKSYQVRSSKRAGDGGVSRGRRNSSSGTGYGYGYGLDDEESDSDNDHCFSFYAHRARIKPVRGSSVDKKDAGNEDDTEEPANRSRVDDLSVNETTTPAGLIGTPQSRRSTIPFSDGNCSLSQTMSGRLSVPSQMIDGASVAGKAIEAGKDTTTPTTTTAVVKRTSTSASAPDASDDNEADADPLACCHCCPCRRPENFHLLLRKRSHSGNGEKSMRPSLAVQRQSSVGSATLMTTKTTSPTTATTTTTTAAAAPAHHQQLFTYLETGDTNDEDAPADVAGEVSIESLAPLTGPNSADVTMLPERRAEPTPAPAAATHLIAPLTATTTTASVNSSALDGASPPPCTLHTAAATPSASRYSPNKISTSSHATIATTLATATVASSPPRVTSDSDEDAPVLSIQNFRRSSSRNIKRLASSADATPL